MRIVTLEIKMMVRFVQQSSLYCIFKLKFGQSHKVRILFWSLNFIFFYLINIFHDEIAGFTVLCFIILIIAKGWNLDLSIIFNKSGLFRTCCSSLLICPLHILHLLHRIQIILYLQSFLWLSLSLWSFYLFINQYLHRCLIGEY